MHQGEPQGTIIQIGGNTQMWRLRERIDSEPDHRRPNEVLGTGLLRGPASQRTRVPKKKRSDRCVLFPHAHPSQLFCALKVGRENERCQLSCAGLQN